MVYLYRKFRLSYIIDGTVLKYQNSEMWQQLMGFSPLPIIFFTLSLAPSTFNTNKEWGFSLSDRLLLPNNCLILNLDFSMTFMLFYLMSTPLTPFPNRYWPFKFPSSCFLLLHLPSHLFSKIWSHIFKKNIPSYSMLPRGGKLKR